MAIIKPFRGIRYNSSEIKDISKVVTPPYDVISPAEQEKYYQSHDYNIIRLTKGKDLSVDNEEENKYTRAASFFKEWCKSGILQREAKPAIYFYEQIFEVNGKNYSRKGFIANIKLEELNTGHIFPHEQTLSGPKVDRRHLINACSANFSCIFSLYDDKPVENKTVGDIIAQYTKNQPDVNFTDDTGVKNLLWVVTDVDVISNIKSLMDKKPLFIADGHHRYETALSYRNDMQKLNNNNEKSEPVYNYVMMMCVAMKDQGLKILPTHRVIKHLEEFDTERVKSVLTKFFTVEPINNGFAIEDITTKLNENADHHCFILYLRDEKRYYLVSLIKEKLDNIEIDTEYSNWKSFDVGILHGIIFDNLFGIKNIMSKNKAGVEFIKNEADAISMVDNDGYQMAFFLNPTNIEDLQLVASNYQIMPPKSTYFYPKLITGMVINKLSDDD